jgi:carboxypeptidase family protein/TonB-dependent receptor-like protein
MKLNKSVAFELLSFLLVLAVPTFGQSDSGSIKGTVTDPNGAVVVGAKITATDLNTGQVRTATTTDEGNYTLPELKANPYRVSVEAQGFKTATIENLKVDVQVTQRADFELQLGSVSDVVTVTADSAAAIQVDSPVRQTTVNERQVKELPLQVGSETAGRTPLAFIFLDSNVTSTTNTGTNASNFRVSGGQGLGTEILIDGAATRRAQNGTFFSEVAPGPNAFQEFTLSTSSFSAEFGNSSGGLVNFTVKSGGNEFHGEVYELHRNEAFSANSFFRNAQGRDSAGNPNQPRERNHQNNFGGNIGGPIYLPRFGEGGPSIQNLKNRGFFFYNYEGYRVAATESTDITVPTAKMRTGDFSELITDPYVRQFFGGPVLLYSPIAGFGPGGTPIQAPPGSRTQIPNNRIDLFVLPSGQSIIDPVGFNILQAFPLPTRDGVFHNYRAVSVNPLTMNQSTGKVDFTISDKQRLGFSYSFRKQNGFKGRAFNPGGFTRFPLPNISAEVWNQFFRSHFARLQHDYSFSPTLLNHFNAGFTRYVVANKNTTEGFDPRTLGFRPNSTQNKAFPIAGFPGFGDPVTSSDPRAYNPMGSTFFSDNLGDNTVQFSDFLTYVRGQHTLKFGADVRKQQFNVHQLIHPGGEFNFRHSQTGNGCCPNNEGWPIASLITGATEFSFNSVQTIDPGWRQFSHSYFVQDDIKVTPRLTLNLGLRYDLPGLRYESHNAFRGFDPAVPNPAAGGRLGAIVGAGGQGGLQAQYRTLAKQDHTDWGPRLGFAYSLNDRTVIRGGAGYYYAPILYGFAGSNSLTEGTRGYNTDSGAGVNGGADANPELFLRSYRPIPPTNPNSQFLTDIGGPPTDYFDKNFKTGRTLQYSLDLQRELPYRFVVSLGYIGHHATRLRSDFERLNALPLNALKLGNQLLNRSLSSALADPVAVAYAQSVGSPLPASNNAVFPGFNGNVAQALRPFPQYGPIRNILESQGRSWYNAAQVKLDRRFAQGIQFGFSYTFSKLITDASEDLFGGTPLGGVLQNPYDRRSLRTVSPNSIPHVAVFNYLIELPFGKGKRFLNRGGFVDKVFGGFQLSGINRYQSGPPLTIRISRGPIGDFTRTFGVFGDLRPNLTGQPIFTSNTGPTVTTNYRLVNPAAFAPPPSFNEGAPAFIVDGAVNPNYRTYYADPLRFFGTAPPVLDSARALPFFSENLSLLKKTRLTETTTLEFRAEVFNLLNRHRFFLGADETNLNNFTFGVANVDQGYRPREMQLGIRFIF